MSRLAEMRRLLAPPAETVTSGDVPSLRRTLAFAGGPGLPLATRAKALAAALFPTAARSRLERPVPDGE